MFAKIVVGVLLVSVLHCESRHQKFIEVPFEEGTSTHNIQEFLSPQVSSAFLGSSLDERPHHSTPTAPNQHFTSNEQQFQRNFHNHVMHNKQITNPIITNSRPQSIVNGEELLRNSVLRAQLQGAGTLTTGLQNSDFHHTNQVSGATGHFPAHNFPEAQLTSVRGHQSSSGFQSSQPIQSLKFEEPSVHSINNQSSHREIPSRTQLFGTTFQFGSNTPSDYELLNSVAKQTTSKQPVSTFLGVEEPTFRFTGQSREELRKPSEDVFNIAHFLTRQPEVRAPVSPPPQPIFNSQFSQPNHQQVSQTPRLPERPEFLINAQPEAPPSTQFLVNQAPASNQFLVNRGSVPAVQEHLRRPNSIPANDGERQLEEEVFKQQAASAKYSFASQIDDTINGNQHQREEVRDGVNVKGMYSYSDGFVKRTVFYEADDKGYRVVKEEEEPLGNGPQINPKGHANVSSYIAGNAVQYSITADDIQENRDVGVNGKNFIK